MASLPSSPGSTSRNTSYISLDDNVAHRDNSPASSSNMSHTKALSTAMALEEMARSGCTCFNTLNTYLLYPPHPLIVALSLLPPLPLLLFLLPFTLPPFCLFLRFSCYCMLLFSWFFWWLLCLRYCGSSILLLVLTFCATSDLGLAMGTSLGGALPASTLMTLSELFSSTGTVFPMGGSLESATATASTVVSFTTFLLVFSLTTVLTTSGAFLLPCLGLAMASQMHSNRGN